MLVLEYWGNRNQSVAIIYEPICSVGQLYQCILYLFCNKELDLYNIIDATLIPYFSVIFDSGNL